MKHINWLFLFLIVMIICQFILDYDNHRCEAAMAIECAKQGLVQKVDQNTKKVIWVKSEEPTGRINQIGEF